MYDQPNYYINRSCTGSEVINLSVSLFVYMWEHGQNIHQSKI